MAISRSRAEGLNAPPPTSSGIEGERAPQWRVVAAGAATIAVVASLIPDQGGRLLALLAIGCALGLALFWASFGFASAQRELLVRGRTDGIIAQLLMVGLATILFAPALSSREILGQSVSGAFAPIGTQVAVGAALFGIGMQLAGGCGSGTLFSIGGGSRRAVLVLVFFCVGSFIASLHADLWGRLPSFGTVVLGDEFGWGVAAAAQAVVLAGAALVLSRWALNRFWRLQPDRGWWRRGPWPLAFGALALALLNFATLAVAGHPWSITWAFSLWGAKAALLSGWQPSTSAFWQADFQRRALEGPVLGDTTTIMDIGIVLGALCAAGMAGRFSFHSKLTAGRLATAVVGGLAMGYGARIAFGCNIGAFFSGAASTSVHGWIWFFASLFGSAIAVKATAAIARYRR